MNTMELEHILKNSGRYKNKYEKLVENIEYHIYEQKQLDVKRIIDLVIDIDKNALSKRIEIWNAQKNNVRNNDEFDYIEIRIKIAESILKSILNNND